ncbi:MAG: GNAT family N-acetyltransferase [Maritimibacter sp.]|nr:GNAT family N-acetyltransferase [Maritimibacter sp.]
MPHHIECLSDLKRLAELEPQWRDLHIAAGGGVFSGFDWLVAWAEVYGRESASSPLIALTWFDGRLDGALALGISPLRPARFSPRVPVGKNLADVRAGFHEVLLRPGKQSAAARGIVEAIRASRHCRMVDLSPMRGSDALEALVAGAKSAGQQVYRRTEITSATADLSRGWAPYLARRSRNFRKTLKRTNAAIEQAGAVFEVMTGPTADSAAAIARLAALSERSWKARMGTHIAAGRFADFLQALAVRSMPTGGFRTIFLRLGARDIAAIILLRSGHIEHAFVMEFDEAEAALSPGRAILSQALEIAARDGIKVVDMLRSTALTERFADGSSSLERVTITEQHTWPDLAFAAERRLAPIGRNFRRKFRQETRKRAAFKD